jgi:hypothetical protein
MSRDVPTIFPNAEPRTAIPASRPLDASPERCVVRTDGVAPAVDDLGDADQVVDERVRGDDGRST